MTKTLGHNVLKLYSLVASLFPPSSKTPPKLITDLKADPFGGHALNSSMCEMYHCYGTYLSPLSWDITTAKHCQFGHFCPSRNKDVGEDTHVERIGESGRLGGENISGMYTP